MKRFTRKAGVSLVVLALILGGCSVIKTQTDDDGEDSGGQTVHIYEESELPAAAFEMVGEVRGGACKEDVYASSPKRAEAIEELKRQASQRGGEALINVQCRRGESTEDCPGALRCRGDAVRVASVGAVQGASHRSRSDEVGEDNERTGTGWVLVPGVVVTSYQLVQDRSDFSLSMSDTTVVADLVATDEVHNLALLRPGRSSLLPPPIPLARDSIRIGESVFTVGYPSFAGGEVGLRTSTGIISAESGALGDARAYRTTVVGSNEHGGAPLLNFRGQVVGVLMPQSGSDSSTIGYAVKNEYVRRLRTRLDRGPDSLEVASESVEFTREQTSLRPLVERVAPSVLSVTAR